MSRCLNVTELNQLDAMMDRTSPAAIVSALGTLCSIVASEHQAGTAGFMEWSNYAAQLNGACDRMSVRTIHLMNGKGAVYCGKPGPSSNTWHLANCPECLDIQSKR